jgi:hypothetical protein
MKLEEIKNKTQEASDYLVQSLEAGHSQILTEYLGAMAKFHTYSLGNIMLIARQKPSASNVAGVRTWNSLGRFVRRGEKGILILAPMVGRNLESKPQLVQISSAWNTREGAPLGRNRYVELEIKSPRAMGLARNWLLSTSPARR